MTLNAMNNGANWLRVYNLLLVVSNNQVSVLQRLRDITICLA